MTCTGMSLNHCRIFNKTTLAREVIVHLRSQRVSLPAEVGYLGLRECCSIESVRYIPNDDRTLVCHAVTDLWTK
ncbi:hypothetical protein C8R44DRAFT_825986 [Mycena epipterygia]|nr:hypothetical protein C8R44DRAFT_825986 [Mycena epipterygia]